MVTPQGSRYGSQQGSAQGRSSGRFASPPKSPYGSPEGTQQYGSTGRFGPGSPRPASPHSPGEFGAGSPRSAASPHYIQSKATSTVPRPIFGPQSGSPAKSGSLSGSPKAASTVPRPIFGPESGSPAKSGSPTGSPRPASPHFMEHIQSKATSTVPPRPPSGTQSRPVSPPQRKPEVVKALHLPQFIRLKSQPLCRYLMVHPDKRGTPGKLLFCGKQDKTNHCYMFETVHVPGMNQACKIKSMATGKFWKRVPLNKVPECKSAITDGGFFSVILAKGDSEFDGDVFAYKKQTHEIGGLESKLISLWSQDDNKFVAPFCIVKDEKTGDLRYFLGCKPVEEKFNNTYYFHGIYHQHWHVTPDPVVNLGKYGFGF